MENPLCLAPWQIAWRFGIVPQLCVSELEALLAALQSNDSALISGRVVAYTHPVENSPRKYNVVGACAIGLCGWRGRNIVEVDDVRDYFLTVCVEANRLLQEKAHEFAGMSMDVFLRWFDAMWPDRQSVLAALKEEVVVALKTKN